MKVSLSFSCKNEEKKAYGCVYRMVTVEGIFIFIDVTIIHVLYVHITSVCVCLFVLYKYRKRKVRYFSSSTERKVSSLDSMTSKGDPTSDITVTPANLDEDVRRSSRVSSSSIDPNEKKKKTTGKSFVNFLFDPKEKTVLGRSALGWGKQRSQYHHSYSRFSSSQINRILYRLLFLPRLFLRCISIRLFFPIESSRTKIFQYRKCYGCEKCQCCR